MLDQQVKPVVLPRLQLMKGKTDKILAQGSIVAGQGLEKAKRLQVTLVNNFKNSSFSNKEALLLKSTSLLDTARQRGAILLFNTENCKMNQPV